MYVHAQWNTTLKFKWWTAGVVAFEEITDLATPDDHGASPMTPFQMLQSTPDLAPYVWQREYLPDSASMSVLVSRFVQASMAIQGWMCCPLFFCECSEGSIWQVLEMFLQLREPEFQASMDLFRHELATAIALSYGCNHVHVFSCETILIFKLICKWNFCCMTHKKIS
jgi:hypothetical protein